MKKLKNNNGLGIVEILLLIAIVACMVAVLLRWNVAEVSQRENINNEYLSATAGITYYMARLQYWSLQSAEPIEIEEPEVETVSTSDTEEEVEYGSYNLTDHELLAHIIYCEGGNLSEEAMYAIGSVVVNRVKDPRFENTIEGVIFQTGQYAPTWDGNWEKFSEPSDVAWEIAEDLLVNGSVIPSKVIWQAQFPQGKGVWKKIDNQYFCY